MRQRALFTGVLVVSLTLFTACGDDSGTSDGGLEFGRYLRLADTSWDSIEECETAKEEANDGRLFNCAQMLTLNEDGTYFSVLTDIAEPGTFVVEESQVVLTNDLTGVVLDIPLNDDGTLGDGWMLQAEDSSRRAKREVHRVGALVLIHR